MCFFGINRLLYIVESEAGKSPDELQRHIQSEIANFQRDSLSVDDATLILSKCCLNWNRLPPRIVQQ